ncbi:glyoxalase superfamily protein [Pseudomonas matsuisoli]|uniref:Bleomycin resistance protein n=1 Tax=Pseudomonas matsuisoli TaxID=1515666 RepID=A0A917UT05_9PSED|nr:glyoxalase superfamily protein [Pseudomonas matsuisoli]GGJ82956.1 glyoxalase [Pseudomonas matsuisoli]
MTGRLGGVVPVLRSFDEAKARAFYIEFLGFEVRWTHRFELELPLYMEVARGDCVLHLSEHHGDACPGAQVRIGCKDIDAYCASLLASQYGNARPSVNTMPWGDREMSITDPFGNRLTFTEQAL